MRSSWIFGFLVLAIPACSASREECEFERRKFWIGVPPVGTDVNYLWSGTIGLLETILVVAYGDAEPDHGAILELSSRNVSCRQLCEATNYCHNGVRGEEWFKVMDVVAALWEDVYLLNVLCWPSFPLVETNTSRRSYTGNVVVFDASKNVFTNLTQTGQGKYAQALAWFPRDEVILMERSTLRDSDFPFPEAGSLTPFCASISPYGEQEIEEFPRVQKFYVSRSLVSATTTEEGTVGRWRISKGECGREIEIPFKRQDGIRSEWLSIYPLDLEWKYVILGNNLIGTWVARLDEGTAVCFSDKSPVSVQPERGIVLLSERYYPFSDRSPHLICPASPSIECELVSLKDEQATAGFVEGLTPDDSVFEFQPCGVNSDLRK